MFGNNRHKIQIFQIMLKGNWLYKTKKSITSFIIYRREKYMMIRQKTIDKTIKEKNTCSKVCKLYI